jgi:hypothetical protein
MATDYHPAMPQARISDHEPRTNWLGWMLIAGALLTICYGVYRWLHPTPTMVPTVTVILLSMTLALVGLRFVGR